MSTAPVETQLVPRGPAAVVATEGEMSVEQMIAQVAKIQRCMQAVMKKGEHYGVIPGTETKPTLLKPGAEKLCLMFRLDPEYEVIRHVEEPTKISYAIRCSLFHIPTGQRIASGLGSCNSREEKYLRAAPKKCPQCSKETIFRSKPRNPAEEKNPDALGWYCWSKKGGCGKNFQATDESITGQDTGIKDPADLDNTLLKMACKRALIAAVLNGTAASDFFTQDLDELAEKEEAARPKDDGSHATNTTPPANRAAGPAAGDTRQAAPAFARANTVKHDGTFASPEAVKLLHILRGKVGGLVVCSDKEPCDPAKACAYHKQLAAFKDCDGKPIRSSKDLSEAQIENLLGRYKAQIDRQNARAAEQPDIGAIGGGDETPTLELVRRVAEVSTASPDLGARVCEFYGVKNLRELGDDIAREALEKLFLGQWG